MSTLISQTDATEKATVLRDIALRGKSPSRPELIRTGLDVDLLETILQEMNPGRDYMLGWQPIAHWFQTKRHGVSYILPESEMLEEEDQRNDLFVHPYTRLIAEFGMRGNNGMRELMPITNAEYGRYVFEDSGKPIELSYRVCRLRVLYARKGYWIVWVSWPESRFKGCSTFWDMLQAVEEMTPDSMRLITREEGMFVDSVPLYLCNGLLQFQQDSTDERRRLAKLDQDRTEKLTDLRRRFGLHPPLKSAR